MNKTICFFAIILGLLLTGCNFKEQRIAQKLAANLGSEVYNLGYSNQSEYHKRHNQTFHLTIKNLRSGLLAERMTSQTAYGFYIADTPMSYKYAWIDITLNSESSGFSRSYSSDSLALIPPVLRGVVWDFLHAHTFDRLRSVVDTNISDSLVLRCVSELQIRDSLSGGAVNNIKVEGFAFHHLPTTNEPGLLLWLGAETKKSYTRYKMMVALQRNLIRGVQANPED
jgi:hypothetical protein